MSAPRSARATDRATPRWLWGAVLALACGSEPSKRATDADGDGVIDTHDCDDTDPFVGDRRDDQDCDGVSRIDDCDDSQAAAGSRSLDADCDGHVVDTDCDDFDPTSDTRAEDADCDGYRTADDCDDTDEQIPAEDADCDGLRTAVDCNDTDASQPSEDADCDGARTADDCDDTDPLLGDRASDADCDGAVTAADCDDTSPDVGDRALDADCDGALTADDCDDANPNLPSETDRDCDGATVDVDCSDYNPALGSMLDDVDCDGVHTEEDCDDTDPADTRSSAFDADCDNIPTDDDCDDADPTLPWIDDWDCDGVMTHPGGGDMVRISAGTFQMGYRGTETCDQELGSWCWTCGEDLHEVTITRDFFIGVTELTRQEYETATGTTLSSSSDCNDGDCPVTNIQKDIFYGELNTLSVASGFSECYARSASGYWDPIEDFAGCDGYRLPTDAEWELAARCGTETEWAGSDTAALVAVFDASATVPVGSLAPNACGLYDMSGNVGETVTDTWVEDLHGGASSVDPAGPAAYGGAYSVVRGGRANDDSACYAAIHMRRRDSNMRDSFDGFRIVRTAPDHL